MDPRDAAVVVIGAGPAGLAAAAALARAGIGAVLVIDRDDEAGGLPRYCAHPGFGWEYSHRLESGPRFARRLLAALDPGAVSVLARTTALSLAPGPEIEIVGAEHGALKLRPRAVILATGVRERPRSARLVPGRRPERGILTTGQLQQMVTRGVAVGGRRAVVIGTEHVAFSVLLTARHAGLAVAAMVEAEDRVMSHPAAAWAARLLGIELHLASVVDDIDGDGRVEAVVLRGPRGSRRIACDTLVFSGEFVPDAALLSGGPVERDAATGGPVVDQFGRTSVHGIFAAGNLLRAVESSGRAALEGSCVGANAASFLRGASSWRDGTTTLRAGPELAYVMPQLWASGGDGLRALPVSLRAQVDLARARLRVTGEGALRWHGTPAAIRRKRRISLPSAALAGITGAPEVEVGLDAI